MDAHELTTPLLSQNMEEITLAPTKSVYEELREAKAIAMQLHKDSEKILESIEHIETQLSHQLWSPNTMAMTPANPYVETMCTAMKIQTPVKLSDFLQDMNTYLVENQLLSQAAFDITLNPILRNGFGFPETVTNVPYFELLGKISDIFSSA
jgi:hypothetical protein